MTIEFWLPLIIIEICIMMIALFIAYYFTYKYGD